MAMDEYLRVQHIDITEKGDVIASCPVCKGYHIVPKQLFDRTKTHNSNLKDAHDAGHPVQYFTTNTDVVQICVICNRPDEEKHHVYLSVTYDMYNARKRGKHE